MNKKMRALEMNGTREIVERLKDKRPKGASGYTL